jgi:hypothetical protein
MSNADDNQGRRGLFRRNRPTEPVASAPLSDDDLQKADAAVGQTPEGDRKPGRRAGLGRRKAAADGSWSSDVWEDGWDDDWSDRSSRAGVRPAADPRPAEVDAWLASSDDQLGDITRDIARKWTGNKQTEPVAAAITWADDVPAVSSRTFAEDPFQDDSFASEPFREQPSTSVGSFTSDDDLWDDAAASSDWTSAPNDAGDLIDLAEDQLPADPGATPSHLGSTWDDDDLPVVDEPVVDIESIAVDPPAPAAPDFAERPLTVDHERSEIGADSSLPVIEVAQPSSFTPTDAVTSDAVTGEAVTTDVGTTGLVETDAVAVDAVTPNSVSIDAPKAARELAFDFTGSNSETDLPTSEYVPAEHFETPAEPAPGIEFETLSPADIEPKSTAVALEDVVLEDLVVAIPAAEVPAVEIPAKVPDVGTMPFVEAVANVEGLVGETPTSAQTHLGDAIPDTVKAVEAPTIVEGVAATRAPSDAKEEAVVEPIAESILERPTAEMAPAPVNEPTNDAPGITVHEPVERDEFLDSLYEELDEDDVPAERKIVHQQPAVQVAPATPEVTIATAENLDVSTAVPDLAPVETMAVEPTPVEDDSDFAPRNEDFDRRAAELLSIPSAQALVDSGSSPLVPQDPNADFDFGPDRPVYAPKGPQSGLPVGKEPTDGTRSAAEMGPASTTQGPQSGLPVGEEPTGGTRSAAEMGPASTAQVSPTIAPIVTAAASTGAVTGSTASTGDPAIAEDDDLFPATKADRFAAALDQLDDDQTDPSGLQGSATKKGFLRGRKNRKAADVEQRSAAIAAEPDEQTDLPREPRPTVAAVASTVTSDKLVTPAASTTSTNSAASTRRQVADAYQAPTNDDDDDDDDVAELDDYDDDLDDYPEEAYFSPKLTKLLARAGFLLVALAAVRMLVLVGLAVRDGANDAQGIQDVFHRIGSAFADLGLAHGLMLIVGIAMAAAPALLGDPYIDDESRSIGATFGIGLIAAVFGVFGGFAAARLAMRVNDIAEIANPDVASTTQWAKLAMNLVATAGLSLIAVVAAVRALGGDRPEQD